MHFYMHIYILRSPFEGEHAGFFLGYLSHERGYKVHFFSGFNSLVHLGVVVLDRCMEMCLIVEVSSLL